MYGAILLRVRMINRIVSLLIDLSPPHTTKQREPNMSKQSILPWRATGVSIAVALLLTVLGWASFGQTALAESDQPANTLATITVNTNVPSVNNDGLCSIIEAIENAN